MISVVVSLFSWMSTQVDCDEIKDSVVNHEALSNATFVTNYSSDAFGNISASNFSNLRLVFLFDVDEQPYLPHRDEFFTDMDEIIRD